MRASDSSSTLTSRVSVTYPAVTSPSLAVRCSSTPVWLEELSSSSFWLDWLITSACAWMTSCWSAAKVICVPSKLSNCPSIIARCNDSKFPISSSGRLSRLCKGTTSLSKANCVSPPKEIIFPSIVSTATVAPSWVITTSFKKISEPSCTTRTSWVSVSRTSTSPLTPIILPAATAILDIL